MLCFFFLSIRRPPRSTLFPYTRSSDLFGEVSDRAARLATTFTDHGVGRGDVVMTLIGNRPEWVLTMVADRKSTRLNSSHANISYAVFCLKKKNTHDIISSSLSPLSPIL